MLQALWEFGEFNPPPPLLFQGLTPSPQSIKIDWMEGAKHPNNLRPERARRYAMAYEKKSSKDFNKKSSTHPTTPTVTARVTKLSDVDNPVALASITIADCFVVDSIKVMYSPKKQSHFLSYPSRKTKDDEWKEVAHPVSKEMRLACINAVQSALEDTYEEDEWIF